MFENKWFSLASPPAFMCARPGSLPVIVAAIFLLGTGGQLVPLPPQEAAAQDPSTVPPSVEREEVQIQRGRDVVQVPSLWYQEGDKAPDSLGVLRVARSPEDPDAMTHPEARYQFPVHLQLATFVRNAQVAEIPMSASVIRGDVRGRIIIRSPDEDDYDIAEPYGVEPIKQVPGEKTIVDARAWYEAALQNPVTGERAPENRFHATRELRGKLRSTASGGEEVRFVLLARQAGAPATATPNTAPPIPPVRDRFIVSEVRIETDAQVDAQTETAPRPPLDWTTTVASLAGPSRADIPARGGYNANRIKGDVVSTLRWRVNQRGSYALSFTGSTQATFGDGGGKHNDVPYGVGIAARFGKERALYVRAEAAYEDDPFQAQTFSTGDQRLRLLFGMDYRSKVPPAPKTRWRLSAGPTYFLDRPSSWERGRADARELGVSLKGSLNHRVRIQSFTSTLGVSVDVKQSWGYVRDAGNSNTTLSGRVSFKPNFRLGRSRVRVGPVGYLQYVSNEYADIPGFSEYNLQFGLEATTRLFF